MCVVDVYELSIKHYITVVEKQAIYTSTKKKKMTAKNGFITAALQ